MTEGTPTTELAGIPFAHLDLASATRLLLSAEGRAPVPWRLINTYNISLLRESADYAAILRAPGVNLADGKPVSWALRWLGRRAGSPTVAGHVRGPALFTRVLDEGRRTDAGHYLLGGTEETLDALVKAIMLHFPGARIVGAESPPFRPLTDEERAAQDERIRLSGADLVWVGLGTPLQDHEAVRLAAAVGRPAIAVGAAFDFLAGTRPEAPAWVQRLALEWLFRLASEPRRLWRRYTIGIVRFCLVIVRDLGRRRPRGPGAPSAASEDDPGQQAAQRPVDHGRNLPVDRQRLPYRVVDVGKAGMRP